MFSFGLKLPPKTGACPGKGEELDCWRLLSSELDLRLNYDGELKFCLSIPVPNDWRIFFMWNSLICVMRSVMYSLFYASLPMFRESISPFFLISFSKLGF